MVISTALRLLSYAVGGALDLYLVALLLLKARTGLAEKLVLLLLFASALWHGGNEIALFHRLAVGHASGVVIGLATGAKLLGAALIPALLLHLAVTWITDRHWLGWLTYVSVPPAVWMLRTGRFNMHAVLFGSMLVVTACLLFCSALRHRVPARRRFWRFYQSFACALIAVAAALPVGADSEILALTSLIPPFCFAWFVYRYNFLGLIIGRRTVFALTLGTASALYLLIVRRAADFADEFDVFGRVIEVALILAAGLIWIPLYGWMNRVLSKRTQVFADFSKHVIQEAAAILDLNKRMQYLAEEVGRTLGLRRVLVALSGESTVLATYGPMPSGDILERVQQLLNATVHKRRDFVFVQRENDGTLRQLLDDLGFNYSFPLWYETRLLGLLLVDSYPRIHLDEDEGVLLGLSRQISQSIQTHHLVEAKIDLERALLEQAHLAKLGEHSRSTAHEIKNSLTGMKTLAQVMRLDPKMPEERAVDLDHLVGEIGRLDRLAQQLLVYGRPASRERSDVSLAQLFERARQALPLDCSDRLVRIELADCDLVFESADRESLHQIVLNLVLNAIQVSAPGDTVRLRGNIEPDGGVCIKVSDEGPGIPLEIRDRIFEPFFTTKPGGTGLGLAIVGKNVRELGGRIRVDSPTSGVRGATFTVTIPINVESRKTVIQTAS